jgi:hypothetical protein
VPARAVWLVATVVAAAMTGCGASGERPPAPAAAASPTPTAAGGGAATAAASPSALAMDRSRFFAILRQNGDAQVLQRNGVTDARLQDVFRRACDDIRHGASSDDVFVRYQHEVSTVSGPDGEALANAFADAWGAGITTFCPDATGR